MDIELDPKDQRLLETLSSESGKPVGVLLRELLHEALTSKKANGKQQLGSEEPVTFASICGAGKDIWQGEHAQEYVNRLRDEWR